MVQGEFEKTTAVNISIIPDNLSFVLIIGWNFELGYSLHKLLECVIHVWFLLEACQIIFFFLADFSVLQAH